MAKRRRADVSMRDYVDARFRATDKAVKLALATVKAAMRADDRRLATWLSVAALLASVATAVYNLATHH